MHHPVDHLLALTLAVLFPLRAVRFGLRRLQRSPPDQLPMVRRRVYRDAVAIQWILVFAVLASWIALGRDAGSLGLAPRALPGLAAVVALAGLVIGFVARQRARVLRDDEALDGLRHRLGHLELMLPHSGGEFAAFRRLAVTAGVCEEVLYRGYLTWYFSAWMGPWPAAAASAAVFGVGHLYQGPRGIVQTGLLGGVLGAVYLVSGSLYPCMALHALVDLHSGHLMMRAYQRAEERAREAAAVSEWLGEGGAAAVPGPDPASRTAAGGGPGTT